jgi:hypothetical protein
LEKLKGLHRDQTGSQGLEKLLIIAAIVLPLLGLLIIFRNEIKDWVVQVWKDTQNQATKDQTDFISDKLPA